MTEQTLTWPPNYQLCYSKRAKHARMTLSAREGLRITLPQHSQIDVMAFLQEKRAWLTKHQQLLQQAAQADDTQLPSRIDLQAIAQCWSVSYDNCLLTQQSRQVTLLLRPQQQLVVMGNIANQALCRQILSEWLLSMAQRYLSTWLQELSVATGLHYNRVSIRAQKTRWGSCSASKNINLNYKLLFLPPPQVRNTLLHELCHTVHLNHSAAFWQLLATFDPEWQLRQQELHQCASAVPNWLAK